jgi:hypothetical protein
MFVVGSKRDLFFRAFLWGLNGVRRSIRANEEAEICGESECRRDAEIRCCGIGRRTVGYITNRKIEVIRNG